MEDDNYQAQGGGRKKGYTDEANNFNFPNKEGIVRAERGCTDVPFLLVFLCFIGSMGYVTYVGFKEGDLPKLLAPLDGDNKFCGIEPGYEEFKNLYITDFSVTSVNAIFDSAVCVKACPVALEDAIDCKPTETVKECKPKEAYKSKTVVNVCMPTEVPDSIKEGLKVMKSVFDDSSAGKYVNDLYNSSTACYLSIVMSVVYCLAYIYLMSAFAECIAWICVFLLQIFLLGSTVVMWMTREQKIEHHLELITNGTWQPDSKQDMDATKLEQALLGGTIVVGLLAMGFFCCVCCGKESLQMAIDVIDASADFLAGTKRILLVPGLFFLFQIITVVIWIAAMMCVASMNEITVDESIPQGKNLEWEKKPTYMALYMLFGVLWICAFFEYTSTFIVMVSAATYYFNSDAGHEGSAEVGTGFSWAFNYHAGSIAIGAFIIALIRFIRIVFVYLAQQAEKASGDNQAVKLLVKVASCILACIEKICDYINESAYAYMAVSGDNFCMSAWNGFLLNIKHILKFSFANLIAKVFILLGKVAITAGNMVSLYYIMLWRGDDGQVSSFLGPMVLIGAVTFMTASIFLGLFDTAVMALMTCLAIDMDMNDGAPKFGPPTFHDSVGKIDTENRKKVEEEGGQHEALL